MERRLFLETGLAVAAMAILPISKIVERTIENRDSQTPLFAPSRLGTNIHLGAVHWYGYDPEKTSRLLLELPYEYARIPVPFNQDRQENAWTFKSAHGLVETAALAGKKIILQTGLKTIGYPELRPTAQMLRSHPYLKKEGVVIDSDPEVAKILTDYHHRVIEEFKDYPEIAIIQPENEGWSKRLWVTNYRYFSPSYLNKVLEMVRQEGPQRWQILQNVPMLFDTPEALPEILLNKNIDIFGLNIYNNINAALNELIWPWVKTVIDLAHLKGKKVFGTEYQAAPWLKTDKTPRYQFLDSNFNNGLWLLKEYGVDAILPWDVEQIIWRKYSQNDNWAKHQFEKLKSLSRSD